MPFKFQRKALKFGINIFLVSLVILPIFVFGLFLYLDSDLLYYHWFLNKNKKEVKQILAEDYKNLGLSDNVDDIVENTTIVDGFSSVSTDSEYAVGLNLMLLNKMADGYAKEYIQVVQGHVDGTYIQGGLSNIKDTNGDTLSLDASTILGITNHEKNFTNMLPHAAFNPNAWKKKSGNVPVSGMTVSMFNYKALANCDSSDKDTSFWDLAVDYDTTTAFQVMTSYFKYPTEYMTGTAISKLPSKMNGYGIPSNTVRGKEDTDASYLPDLFAWVVQDFYSTASVFIDGTLSHASAQMLSSLAHNGGGGTTPIKRLVGGGSSSNIEVNDMAKKYAAKYLNDDASVLQNAINRDSAALDEFLKSNNRLLNNAEMSAYAAGVLIGRGGYKIYANNTEFAMYYLAGTNQSRNTFCYLGLTGNYVPNVSASVVRNEILNHGTYMSNSPYPTPFDRTHNNPASYGYLYKEHPNDLVTVDGKQTAALSQWNIITLGHSSSTLVNGKIAIWKMMQIAGVDCSLEEANTPEVIKKFSVLDKVTDVISDTILKKPNLVNNGWASPFPSSDWKKHITTHALADRGSYLHKGTDVAGGPIQWGTPIQSVHSGIVTQAGWENSSKPKQGYGQRVYVDCGNGIQVIYGHLSQIMVEVGDSLKVGDMIGLVGNTGECYGTADPVHPGSHLHIQIEDASFHNNIEHIYIPEDLLPD